jgi:peptide/nickel transport system substrate-binding protein
VQGAATVQQVCEQLVRVGADLIPRPHLAESWTASADAKTWTFKIRQGVTFNNGASFSADDVVWTFQYLLDPKTASTTRTTLTYLTSAGVEKIDQYTVRFHLNRSVAIFPADLSNYMIVMLPKNWPGNFIKNPIGTGPFLLTEYVAGDHATYKRNPNYWNKPLPYLDGLRLTYSPSGTSEVNLILAGQSDMMSSPSSSQAPTLSGSSKIKLLSAQTAGYDPIYFRTDMKPFSDNRVREAFKYMVDREQLVKLVYQGHGVPGNDHMVAPVYPEYSNNGMRKQDLAKAKALLAAAGYAGLQIDMYGVSPAGSPGPELSVPTVFQQVAAAAGVQVRLRPEPVPTFYTHWTQVPFAIVNWVGRPTVNAMLNLAYRCGVPWNAAHWCAPQFDGWLNALDATVDMSKRHTIARQIEEYMTNNGPAIIWGFTNVFRAVGTNVNGIIASPISHVDLDTAWLAK